MAAVDDEFPADLHPAAEEGHGILCQRDSAGAVKAVGDLHSC